MNGHAAAGLDAVGDAVAIKIAIIVGKHADDGGLSALVDIGCGNGKEADAAQISHSGAELVVEYGVLGGKFGVDGGKRSVVIAPSQDNFLKAIKICIILFSFWLSVRALWALFPWRRKCLRDPLDVTCMCVCAVCDPFVCMCAHVRACVRACVCMSEGRWAQKQE